MTAKLYIGNIAYNVCKEDLCALFAEAGTVIASRVILDKTTGKSRGFGFVEMSTQNEAEKVISQFNGYSLLGRNLLVYLAHDDRELSRRAREAKQAQKHLVTSSSSLEQKSVFYSQTARNGNLSTTPRTMDVAQIPRH